MKALVDQAHLTRKLTGPGRLWTSVTCIADTGSTNADLAAVARAGGASGAVLIADHQSAGRGRFDRSWEAPPGSSIAISVMFRPGSDVPVSRWPWLPLVTGLAVADGIRAAAGVEVEVKWPNDVLIGGLKVCGILAERVADAAVIGIGINICQTADQLPVPTATSLRLAGSDVTGTEVALVVLGELERAVREWESGADLMSSYTLACDTVGRRVRVLIGPGDSVSGDAVGVDSEGRLLVNDGDRTRAFSAGDVLHLR